MIKMDIKFIINDLYIFVYNYALINIINEFLLIILI